MGRARVSNLGSNKLCYVCLFLTNLLPLPFLNPPFSHIPQAAYSPWTTNYSPRSIPSSGLLSWCSLHPLRSYTSPPPPSSGVQMVSFVFAKRKKIKERKYVSVTSITTSAVGGCKRRKSRGKTSRRKLRNGTGLQN